jgi:diaminopimelate decarboxylase
MNSLPRFEERVLTIKNRKADFLKIAKEHGTPLYIYDKEEVQNNYRTFRDAFLNEGIDMKVFYAVKSNYYPGLLRTVVQEGGNLDVSSDRELKLALEAGATKIIYTGPGKSESDFALILDHHEKITVNLESVREMELLAKMAAERKVVARCGVRIITAMQAGWTKFGIPIKDLADFFQKAQMHPSLKFCGVHFHISFNNNPSGYVKTLEEVSLYLQKHLSAKELAKFEYLDIGGGYYPAHLQAKYTWNLAQTMELPANYMAQVFADDFESRTAPIHTEPIEVFAKEIAVAVKKFITPFLPNVQIYTEPGRYISHSSLHFLLRLMDIKEGRIGIVDGGMNLIGWEIFQYYYYAPVFNLSQFSAEKEIPFLMYGSLCTPDDVWGYYMYTAGQPKEGDVLMIPYQGAYTYTMAQTFIKKIAPVYDWKE